MKTLDGDQPIVTENDIIHDIKRGKDMAKKTDWIKLFCSDKDVELIIAALESFSKDYKNSELSYFGSDAVEQKIYSLRQLLKTKQEYEKRGY